MRLLCALCILRAHLFQTGFLLLTGHFYQTGRLSDRTDPTTFSFWYIVVPLHLRKLLGFRTGLAVAVQVRQVLSSVL
jgi:hypothetical protein